MLRLSRSAFRSFSTSCALRMKVVPVPVREDNYAYILIDDATNQAAVVDPYDVTKVAAAADRLGVEIVAAITTHHHFDHSSASTYPDAVIYAGSDQAPSATRIVKDKEEFTLGANIRIKCLATPCHTQDSIASTRLTRGVFTGDTLFIAGCGRFFEGTGDEMNAALSYLGTLPDKTIAYIGHEYTASNLAFARSVDPENTALSRLAELVHANKVTAGLTTIGDEKQWNLFMRLKDPAVRRAARADANTPDSAVMDALREQKNKF
ncbi:beta-lactamase-like protein [Mycena filopes]|nr:beta-lactamase-like protein [Mycena filopes]